MKIFCFFINYSERPYLSSFCYSVFKELFLRAELSKLNRKSVVYGLLVFLLRKEVIHPHVPVGIPCYDLTPIISPTFDGSLLVRG